MPRYNPYDYQEDPLDQYGAAQYGAGIGSGALSGAAAGSTFGPWGTLIGGLGGALVGGLGTASDEQKYLEAQRQQAALERDLASRDVYDRMLQGQGLSDARQRQETQLQAQEAAARGNLSPQSTAQLQLGALNDLALTQAAAKPGLFLAAQQADQQRQQGVLQQYQVAQELATGAGQGIGNWQQGLGAATQAAALVGTMKQPAATTVPAASTATPFATTTPQEAALYWNVDAVPQGATPVTPPVGTGATQVPGGAVPVAPAALPAAISALQAAQGYGTGTPTPAVPPSVGGAPAAPAGLKAGPPKQPDVLPETVRAAVAGDAGGLLALPPEYDNFLLAYGSDPSTPPAPRGVDQTAWAQFTTEMATNYGIEPQYLTKEFFDRWINRQVLGE